MNRGFLLFRWKERSTKVQGDLSIRLLVVFELLLLMMVLHLLLVIVLAVVVVLLVIVMVVVVVVGSPVFKPQTMQNRV